MTASSEKIHMPLEIFSVATRSFPLPGTYGTLASLSHLLSPLAALLVVVVIAVAPIILLLRLLLSLSLLLIKDIGIQYKADQLKLVYCASIRRKMFGGRG
jgi:hypothetical protein